MSRDIIEAVRTIEREKGIEEDTLITALEDALLAAYKKTPGASRHATVELDHETGDFRVFSIELPKDLEEQLLEEARERAYEELEALEIETGEKSHVLVSDDDLDLDWTDVPEEQIKREDVTPENFGRIAAQTAKQVILQRIREAEREMMYEEYKDRQGEVVTGIVQQAGDRNNVLIDLGKVEALLPRSEQVDGERYEQGSRIKAVITEVRSGTKGPQVILSRRDPELIRTLFELEVPEIADGLVEIRGVAREPGYRSKIAVQSHTQGVDPVGACVGPRGSRVRMVVSELRGDENDISGRCAAVLSNGKRCPNAALPGSKYCGVPAHQDLALHETDAEDNPIVDESEPELERLSDTAEPEAVTEDAAAFGNPAPE